MNNQFDELSKGLAQSVTCRAALKKFGASLAGMAMAAVLALPSAAADSKAGASTVLDPEGDAVFPVDLYDGPVPSYLDIVAASVSYARGIFHFEIQMNAQIPADPDLGLTPSVNHLGATFGVLTNRKTGLRFKFVGQPDVYYFNFLVGALYSAGDSGIGLPLGWSGFLIETSTFSAVPLPVQIRGDTFVFETSAASLGDPTAFNWVVGSECDPVPIPNEDRKLALLVDFAPDHGYASWPAQ